MLIAGIAFYFHMIIKANGALMCDIKLHKEMVTSLVNAPINLFHDKTPKGRLFNRLSNDLDKLHNSQHSFGYLVSCLCLFICSLVVCSIFQYLSIIFLVLMLIYGIFITKFYLGSSRDLTRMRAIAKSPILNTLSEALPGAITIRSYKFEDKYMHKFNEKIDDLFKIEMFISGTYNWFGFSMDIAVFVFMTFLIIFVVAFREQFSPQSIGLLLMYCPNLQTSLFNLLNMCGAFSNDMVSMERCLRFTKIESEKDLEGTSQGEFNQNAEFRRRWPSNGAIEFRDYSVRYRPETELVLKNINLTINGKEKIGVVGRTGSGKSTICLSLFRLIEPSSGGIYIDGVDITQIGLRHLREKLTIISQDPNLVNGTLRYNIDPLNLRLDKEIEEVMRSINFWYIAENSEDGLHMMVRCSFL